MLVRLSLRSAEKSNWEMCVPAGLALILCSLVVWKLWRAAIEQGDWTTVIHPSMAVELQSSLILVLCWEGRARCSSIPLYATPLSLPPIRARGPAQAL